MYSCRLWMCRSASGVKITLTKSLFLARCAARLDAPEDRVGWNALRRIAQVFLMPRHDFFTKPALHRRIALQKGEHAVAHDFANGGISPRLDFALHGLGHVVRQSNAELLCGSHKRSPTGMLPPSSSNGPSVFPNLRNRAKPSMAE